MVLDTKHFGNIDVDDNKIIEFRNGLPGFTDSRHFVLLAEGDTARDTQLYWLQSVDQPQVAFVMVDMVKMYPEYNPLVERDEFERELGSYNPSNFYIYNIASIPENVNEMTVNLKAPVVINDALKRGMQVICENDEYSVRHYMFK